MEMIYSECKNCGNKLDSINFTALMTEQWIWNGERWECSAHNSLIDDPEQQVFCTECNQVVGIGKDFGF